MRNSKQVGSAFIVGAIGLSSCPVTWAQQATAAASDTEAVLAEITVTAQRHAENLQKVPVAVQAFNADTVATAGVVSTADLAMLAPTLTFGAQTGWAQPRLRGIGTVALGPGIENPVATYVDGVYYAAMSGGTLELNNVETIEVINGPQGTLFGRNATGGLIQVRTKTPSHYFGGHVAALFGNYDTIGTEGYITGGVTQNIAADLAVSFRDQGDGYGKNFHSGADVEKSNNFVVRSKVLYTPTSATKVTLAGDYGDTNAKPVLAPAPGTTPLGGPPYDGPPRSYNGLFDPSSSITQYGGSATIEHEFSTLTFSSITAYRHTRLHNRINGALTPNPQFALNVEPRLPQRQISQELQASSPAGSAITWVAGLYYFDEIAKFDPVRLYGNLLAPVGMLEGYTTSRTHSGSVYGQATKEIMADTKLTLGARYIMEQREASILRNLYSIAGPRIAQQTSADEKTFEDVTWRIALDHEFTPDILSYVSYNRGFKSGGYNPLTLPAENFAPEQLDAYEIGVKTKLFENRLRFNTAAFYYDYANVQVVSYKSSLLDVYNGAAAEVYGVDVDLEWVATRNLSLKGGVSYLHAAFDSFPDSDLTSPRPGGGTQYVVGSAAGNKLPFAPDWVANVSVNYAIPTSFGDFAVSLNYLDNSGWFASPDNRLRQEAYDVLNAQVGWTSDDGSYELRAWGRNLTDAVYATTTFAQARGDVIEYAPPRTYGITILSNF